MVDVLIRNVTIPKKKALYVRINPDGSVEEKIGCAYHKVMDGKILEPHGPLKDTDDLYRKFDTELALLKGSLAKVQYEAVEKVFLTYVEPFVEQTEEKGKATKQCKTLLERMAERK